MKLNRRTFLQLGTAGLIAPRSTLAGPPGSDERCFLFVYCSGGWDTTRVFTPLFDTAPEAMEPEATTASESGIAFVDHPERPGVRWFFENWGDRTAVVDGFEARSVAHDTCLRLVGPLSASDTSHERCEHACVGHRRRERHRCGG